MLFRDALKQFREPEGLTQEALAQRAGTSVGNVRNYEQGIRLPTFPQVVKLATALGLSCEDFARCEDVTTESAVVPSKDVPAKKGRKK
jgi:transcriptional regulator with XRE-family HTH domain